jgi:hypothetical protein
MPGKSNVWTYEETNNKMEMEMEVEVLDKINEDWEFMQSNAIIV